MRRQLESEHLLNRIVLPRFDLATVREIACPVAGDGEDVEAIATQLFQYSEGVPLFLDEAVHRTVVPYPAGV